MVCEGANIELCCDEVAFLLVDFFTGGLGFGALTLYDKFVF
jgi:hypothetical protein